MHTEVDAALKCEVDETERLRAALVQAEQIYMGEGAVVNRLHGMLKIVRAALSGEPTSAVETSERHALAEEIVELRGALLMLYDKWENGAPCYEEPEEQRGYLGHAFNLTEQEENRVLALLPEGCPEPSEKASDDWRCPQCGSRELLTSPWGSCRCGWNGLIGLPQNGKEESR